MDTKHLTYILTIARKKNMTKAAEELYVSQSSLSQYVSKLEQEIGVPLFIRAKGELALTPAGLLYVKAAEQVLHIQEDLYHNIRSLHNKGHITIGVTSQYGLELLTEVIPAFKEDYPEVTIEFSESNVPGLTRLLLDEDIDCGIMALNTVEAFSPEQIIALKEEEVFLAIPESHPCRKHFPGSSISEEELVSVFDQDNFILSTKGSTLRHLADQIFSRYDFHPRTICETNSILAAGSMVAKGTGVTFLASSCASIYANVACYSMVPSLTRYNAFVCRKNWILNPPEKHFIQIVSHYFNHPFEQADLLKNHP